jgi:6,7-dimethyl-8-ribityllumazine synthase
MSLKSPSTEAVDGTNLRVGIVAARFNQTLVDGLLKRTLSGLKVSGVPDASVEVTRVPGSNEVPIALRYLAETGRFDVCIGLGLIIRGDTIHYEIIAHGVSQALHDVELKTGIPAINGIIVAENEAQAQDRCAGAVDRGGEFAATAVEMGELARAFSGRRT